MKKERYEIKVTGVVQGVGFRPFVFRLASFLNLKGWVRNTSGGVEIEVEGHKDKILNFINLIKTNCPPLARVEHVSVCQIAVKGDEEFKIKKSKEQANTIPMIPPDVSVCNDCINDFLDKKNRRYGFAFTNCTNCGPRFSIIKKVPYDRSNTTMKVFDMCDRCNSEYNEPGDRRFHAQPNACSDCGPVIWLTDTSGRRLWVEEPVKIAAELIKEGKIVAVKGLGGFHLICNAKNNNVVAKLRRKKRRPDKPFALMIKDLNTVKEYCFVNAKEENILTGFRKPILLLNKKGEKLSRYVAPNSKYYGVMLPYTPLHYLLFQKGLSVVIATSANVSGSPLKYKNNEALNDLKSIADFFLFHDRGIFVPVDDSISRVIMNEERLIRHSRGYAPQTIKMEGFLEGMALGGNQKNTVCMAKEGYAFLSQHLGDLNNEDALKNFQFNVKHLKKLYDLKPVIIAHDLHPGYLNTGYARREKVKNVGIQHHHAHIASCLVENGVKERVIGLAFDGTGYGTDGKIWGGEFLLCNLTTFKRVGHLKYVKMPGGEKAITEPWRMAVSYLVSYLNYDLNRLYNLLNIKKAKIRTVLKMLKEGFNCPETSSIGRMFDSVAVIIGLRNEITFQAQAAMELESISKPDVRDRYFYQIIKKADGYIVNPGKIFAGILEDRKKNVPCSVIGAKFHNSVIAFSANMCKLLKEKYGVNRVVLSGGVFQNELILKGLYRKLKKDGFEVYTHKKIPCNDGGISVGQMAIASLMERR